MDMMPLLSYLILPVQRIPRYNMLLRDLVKETVDSHPDAVPLSEVIYIKTITDKYHKICVYHAIFNFTYSSIYDIILLRNIYILFNFPSLPSPSPFLPPGRKRNGSHGNVYQRRN